MPRASHRRHHRRTIQRRGRQRTIRKADGDHHSKDRRSVWPDGDACPELPIVGTIAAQFNDGGVNELFEKLMGTITQKTGVVFGPMETHAQSFPSSAPSPHNSTTGASTNYSKS